MKFLHSLLLALFVCSPAPGQNARAVQMSVVAPPEFGQFPHASNYASEEEYREARADKRFAMKRLAYKSDGRTVYAYVYGRESPTSQQPVIVFNRGSWTWPDGFAGELLTMAHRLAEGGYVVVAPMFRGSGGAGGVDEMGGADLDDLMNLEPLLAKLPGVAADQVYLYGESRGGMMVYQALRDGFHARAAAVVGGFTDLDDMLSIPKWAAAGAQIWPDLASRREELVRRRSASLWPEKINSPILIIHGARDSQVPPRQSIKMADNLIALGKPVQLLIVDGEGHTIGGRAADRDAWVVDWFRRH